MRPAAINWPLGIIAAALWCSVLAATADNLDELEPGDRVTILAPEWRGACAVIDSISHGAGAAPWAWVIHEGPAPRAATHWPIRDLQAGCKV